MFERRGRLLFVNKKKQKNFFKLDPCRSSATGPVEQKFFAPLFFKKAAAFSNGVIALRSAMKGRGGIVAIPPAAAQGLE